MRVIGAEFVKRHGETPIVVNAVAAHHEEVKPETVYAGLVILADTVSAVRPGARAESMAGYIQRLERLEKLALSMEGVQQAYAIQAGREVRVVVNPQAVTDEQARRAGKEAPPEDRGGAAVPEHDQDHRHPGAAVQRDGDVACWHGAR